MEVAWDQPEYQHWIDLHRSGKELRGTVDLTLSSIEAVESDNDLSIEGKRRKRRELAKQALEQLEQPKSLAKARESCASVLGMWQTKIDNVLVRPKPEDAATALLHREVRDKFAAQKDERAERVTAQSREKS